MNTLIKITEQIIDRETVQTVNARELHVFLESKQDFSTWIKKRIAAYSFLEGQDFIRFHKKNGSEQCRSSRISPHIRYGERTFNG
ncbi:hypothetical protein GCM10023260_12300 [Bartonella acomydis]|uniref:AntA/AntB antirepressor domain-containing protein n=1 Tax=Bartonella acomydis TaxID=686234 RepID=A0ABP9MRD6_9HYPH